MPKLPSSAGPTPKAITSRSVLLVEGNDEKGFFEALAKDMHLEIGRDIEFRLAYGIGFKEKFEAILNDPGFYNVRSYGIVRDADKNAQEAFESIQSMLNSFGYRCPDNHAVFAYDVEKKLKVGIFIMPGHIPKGRMLEDLCLESVRDHPIMPFVAEYITNVKQKMQSEGPKNESKAKVQTFLAGMKDIVPHLGVAADRGYWNFKSTAIDEIRAFIHELTV